MTLSDAVQTMGATVRIVGVSAPALVDDVVMRQAALVSGTRDLPHKDTVIEARGLNGDLKVRPIAAMLELARGTALNDDPEIAAVARRWSVLRHLGMFAIEPRTGSLHLDAAALQFIGPNQRRVLSEELGIGFGIVAAKAWCRARDPAIGSISAIDVDKALYPEEVPNLQRNGRRQPDYLLSYPDPTNPRGMVYELLETKGTVNHHNAKGQLGRAVTQLVGLTVGGRPLTGVATSTVSNTDGITVMAVDPEEVPKTWEPAEERLEYWRGRGGRVREDAIKLDVDPDELFARATNVDRAALAEYGGQYDAATRWLPSRALRGSGRGNAVVQRETSVGTFVGAESVIDVGGAPQRLRLFQGVEMHVAEELRGLDAAGVVEAQQLFARRDFDRVAYAATDPVVPETGSAVAVSSDGSILALSVE